MAYKTERYSERPGLVYYFQSKKDATGTDCGKCGPELDRGVAGHAGPIADTFIISHEEDADAGAPSSSRANKSSACISSSKTNATPIV